MQSKEAIRELISTLESAEITNEVIEWMRDICKPEALIIDTLVKEFVASLDSAVDYCNAILKALQ
jgi:hypothetical protein